MVKALLCHERDVGLMDVKNLSAQNTLDYRVLNIRAINSG